MSVEQPWKEVFTGGYVQWTIKSEVDKSLQIIVYKTKMHCKGLSDPCWVRISKKTFFNRNGYKKTSAQELQAPKKFFS